ncbi:MAG: bacterio-opsin activator domain-containing protein [Salinirussus sp.]
MTGDRILLVGPSGERRERLGAALSGDGLGVTVRDRPGDVAHDCVVAAPARGEAEATAELLCDRDGPAVLLVDSEADASSLLTRVDVVVRRGEGSERVVVDRVRELLDGERRSRRRQRVAASGSTSEPEPGPAAGPAGVADGGTAVAAGKPTDGFLALDADHTVAYASDGLGRSLGADGNDPVGREFRAAFPELWEAIAGACREAADAGAPVTVAADELGTGPDGRFEARIYPRDDGDGLSVFLRDVTDRRRASDELAASGAALGQLHRIISDADLSAEVKLRRILELGRDRLGVEFGVLSRIEDGTWNPVEWAGTEPDAADGEVSLDRTYCRRAVGANEPLAVLDATDEGWTEDPAYEHWQLSCYLGMTVVVDGESYGTVCFGDPDPRREPFTGSEEAFVELVSDWIGYVLERDRYEAELRDQRRRLEREQAFVESLLDSLPDPLYAFDEAGELVRWNDRLATVTGYDDEELAGMEPAAFVAEKDRDAVRDAVERVRDGEQISVEVDLETSAGDYLPYEVSGAPMREDGEVVGLTGVARDVRERQAQREMLSGLLETTRSLMQGRDRSEVADVVAAAAREVLDFDITLVRLYDPDDGTLRPVARTEPMSTAMGERPVYEVGEGIPGEVFATGEPRTVTDARAEPAVVNAGRVRSVLYQPMGVHGTISVGATEPDAFDETDRQVLALLSTAAAAACTRAKREREVREAREHTERVLNRINGLIENTVEVLVQAATREELEAGVVSELAAAEPYTFAWIGQPDVASETLSPSVWDGEADVPAADFEFDLEDDGPVAAAYRHGSPRIVQDIAASAGDVPHAATVEAEGAEASIVVPLRYKDTTYGVLAVFADEAGAFDEREQVVLEALGRAVANAINAVERGRIMDATEIIELELTVDDPELLFCRLSGAGGCRIEVAGTDYRPDGSIRLYITAEGAGGDELAALARENSAVTEASVIADHDGECLLELTVEESILATLSEFGSVAREVVAEGGTTRLSVELPYETEAREVFELVEGRYPNTSLAGYHERERRVETRQEFRAALFERFTDRQETALRTAYLGGFFEWPRGIDGNELAAAMDISRPTYHQHLRAAQRKVLEEVFE